MMQGMWGRGIAIGGALLLLGGVSLWYGQQPASAAVLGSPTVCAGYSGLPEGWKEDPLAGMTHIKGGTYTPGSSRGYADEWPGAQVTVGDFWIDRTEVTRAQFAAFVAVSGYVTEAERAGGAAVFRVPSEAESNSSPLPWWHFVAGANWRHPEGPDAPAAGGDNLPVTLVTLADAQAYARWLGNDLPTEAEWEYAARGGRSAQAVDAAPVDGQGRPAANFWQGVFPLLDSAEDGFAGLAPAGCFPANPYGLFDMIGNVWEWTADAYGGPHQGHANGDPGLLRSPLAVARAQVIKGGSFLCAANYCVRYRASARERQEPDLATSHVGFRTIRRVNLPGQAQ